MTIIKPSEVPGAGVGGAGHHPLEFVTKTVRNGTETYTRGFLGSQNTNMTIAEYENASLTSIEEPQGGPGSLGF